MKDTNTPDEKDMADLLQQAAVAQDPPAGLKQAIRERLQSEPPQRRRRRFWRALAVGLPIAAAIVAAVVVLLRPGNELPALADMLERAKGAGGAKVKSVYATQTAELPGGGQQVQQTWYRRPNQWRQEDDSGVIVDDGKRMVVFDPKTRRVKSVRPSMRVDKFMSRLHVGVVEKLLSEKGRSKFTIESVKREALDGTDCVRYDVTTGGDDRQMKLVLWFSEADGLFRQMERTNLKGTANRVVMTLRYNVDVADELVTIPDDLVGLAEKTPPPDPELVVTVVDAEGRPAPDAVVYVGRPPFCDRLRPDEGGQVKVELKSRREGGQVWTQDDTGAWYSGIIMGKGVVAESADASQCDVFSMMGLYLLAEHGFLEIDVKKGAPKALDSDAARLVAGLRKQLRYEPDTRRLTLRLRLVPKAVVTGRVVDEEGQALEGGEFHVQAYCFPRGYEETGGRGYVMHGLMHRLPDAMPEQYDMTRFQTPVAEDGTFELAVPAGHAFKIMVHGLQRASYPAGPRGVAPAKALEPAERRDVGEIRLAPRPDGD